MYLCGFVRILERVVSPAAYLPPLVLPLRWCWPLAPLARVPCCSMPRALRGALGGPLSAQAGGVPAGPVRLGSARPGKGKRARGVDVDVDAEALARRPAAGPARGRVGLARC